MPTTSPLWELSLAELNKGLAARASQRQEPVKQHRPLLLLFIMSRATRGYHGPEFSYAEVKREFLPVLQQVIGASEAYVPFWALHAHGKGIWAIRNPERLQPVQNGRPVSSAFTDDIRAVVRGDLWEELRRPGVVQQLFRHILARYFTSTEATQVRTLLELPEIPLRDALIRVMDEYAAAAHEEFARHPLAQFVRSDLAAAVAAAAPGFGHLLFEASAGAGNWAEGPWAAIFDPVITDTAQAGFYPVYLFSSDLDTVYLSMNQGVTNLKDELGVKAARELLRSRAEILRARAKTGPRWGRFTLPIALQASKPGSNLELHEGGHAFGCRYDRKLMPTELELRSDLEAILQLYAHLRNSGGYDELHDMNPEGKSQPQDQKREEARRRLLHERVERNRKLAWEAKQHHGYVCQVCAFDFKAHFGELGSTFIVAHHKTPLSKLAVTGPILLSPADDFAVVCANCHAMIHARGAPDTFEAFVAFYESLHPKPSRKCHLV